MPASALSWTVLLHHNTHVHTFVGGTGPQGSFVAENHGPIGTFSYEIILDRDRQQRAEGQHQRQPAGRRRHVAAVGAVGVDARRAVGGRSDELAWTAATDNVAVAGYRVERCQGAGCTNFAQVGTPAGTTFRRQRR